MSITVLQIVDKKYLNYNRSSLDVSPSAPEDAIFQTNILTRNQYYIVETNLYAINSGVTISFRSFDSLHDYTTTGQKRFVDKAKTEALFVQFQEPVLVVNPNNTLIDYIYMRPVPTYTLRKCTDNSIVQEFDPSELYQQTVEVSPSENEYGNIIKLDIDLSVLNEDSYYFEFTDEGVTYRTEPFFVKLLHECTFELTWSDSGNPYNFQYTDIGGFTQSLRVEAKLGRPKYAYDRNEKFVDSRGNRILTYVRQDKSEILTIAEMPEYCHDALALGLKHSSFQIDGAEYVFEEDEYTPAWRKSSENAPVEVELRRQDVNLVKSNC